MDGNEDDMSSEITHAITQGRVGEVMRGKGESGRHRSSRAIYELHAN